MKSNESIKWRRAKQRSQLSRRLLLQYAVTMLVFAVAYAIFLLISMYIGRAMAWDRGSLIYRVLISVEAQIIPISFLIMLVGWAIVSYYYISKPLHYLDEIVEASANLTNLSEEPIVLSDAVKNVQDELNAIRESAIKNATAAKEAEQRKNDLIVYLAHDLKTPLTSVIGYLTLLRDEQEISPALREKYTNIALDKAERLENLINEFFDITRFNLTQLTLEEEVINLTRMLEQLAYEFNPILAEKSLLWDLHLEPDVKLICDPEKLQRVFDNLFRNAVHYSYDKSSIEVLLTREGSNVAVRITNQGKTIAPEHLHRIFDQFFRLDSSRSTATGGAGLGLAIAKEIVELHGGTIVAESEQESIIFTIRLPLSRGI